MKEAMAERQEVERGYGKKMERSRGRKAGGGKKAAGERLRCR